MLIDTDPRAAAHVNLHAVLGAIPELLRRSPAAREIALRDPRPTSIRFAVRGGPSAALAFRDGEARLLPDAKRATILLPFASPAAFNRVIDGAAQPVPVTGLHRIGFLTGVFAPLTDELTRYLRPAPTELADPAFPDHATIDPDPAASAPDPAFRDTSTILTLHVAVAAVAQLANHDVSGRYSAASIPDGDIALEVIGGPTLTVRVRDHHATFVPGPTTDPRAVLQFASLDVAGAVLSGELSALAGVSDGSITMRGLISMIDNVNRILDRVGVYLPAPNPAQNGARS